MIRRAVRRDEAKVVSPTVRPRLLPFAAACKYGGFGRSKGYALIREGKIAAYRMGKKTMIDVASIDAFHESLPKLGPTPAPGGFV